MYDEYECPRCGKIFEINEWHDGECPRCGNEFWWEEEYNEDDYWGVLEWGDYDVDDYEDYEDDV